MREIVSRLRAALSPWIVLIFAAAWVVLYLATNKVGADTLESRIGRTLSAVEGAGNVEVTIRMRQSVSDGGAFSAAEKEQIPCGAVAVAQGADDPLVALALHDALCALLGLPPASVSVMTGGK